MSTLNDKDFSDSDILIVDDNVADLKLLVSLLSEAGYKVRPATSGELALRSVQTKLPDLILLDIIMPNIDGYEVCRRLKADEKTSSIPVIFITSMGEEKEKVKGFQAGVVDYIYKPIQKDGMLARIRTHLTLRRAQLELIRSNAELSELNTTLTNEITERKRVEEELKLRAEMLDQATDGIVLHDFEGNFVYANETCLRERGYTREEFLKMNSRDVVADSEKVEELLQEIIEKGFRHGEFDIRSKDGTLVPMDAVGTVIKSRDKEYILSVTRNITERKKAEEALRSGEERMRLFMNSATDAFSIYDSEFKLVDCNDTSMKMYFPGLKKGDVIGKNLLELLPRLNGTERYARMQKVIKTGEPFFDDDTISYSDDPSVPELERRHISIKVFKVGDGLGVVSTDITEHIKADEKIKVSLAEKELLLKEVYHRVKNNMQVVSSLLNLQSRAIRDEETLELFRESQMRIKSMEIVHNKLYQSANLASINFKEYIKELANELISSYRGSGGRLAMKIEGSDVSLGVDQAIPCGLVVNELFTNSLKYAFPGNAKGEITFSISETRGGVVQLIIADNGVGIPESLDIRNLKSLGLYLVTTLVEQQLGGKLKLEKSAGAKYSISFKKK